MSIYSKIYYNLCSKKCQLKESYKPGSGLHKHHIIPRHTGGSDEDSNLTYLTVREHIIAHFLLWKIHKNPNDLRAMHMLGAELTVDQRRTVGLYCAQNKIGFHKASKEEKQQWILNGVKTQISNEIGIHNPCNFKKHASLGGKASIKSENNPWSYWASEEGRKHRAKLGAAAIKGRCVMYKPGDTTFKRIKKEEVDKYIKLGYVFGSPIPAHNKKKKI